MKSLPKMILPLAMMLTGSIHAQDVGLGDALFNAASADSDATWYEPMALDHPTVFEGYGKNAGSTRTVTFSAGGQVAGVKTIKRHLVISAPNAVTEDMWLAFDASDDLRVIKIVRAGAVVFQAEATATPPLYLPSLPTVGQSWDQAGTTITIEQVMPSNSGCRLKIKAVTAAGKLESSFLHAGEGLLLTEAGEDSGWKLKQQGAAPLPPVTQ